MKFSIRRYLLGIQIIRLALETNLWPFSLSIQYHYQIHLIPKEQ